MSRVYRPSTSGTARCRRPRLAPADPVQPGGQVGELKRPGERASLIGLGVVWAVMLGLHLLLRLPDVGLWIGFPLLFLPWLLFGASNWFDR